MMKLEAEQKALDDFNAVNGRVLYVRELYGYVGDDSVDVSIQYDEPWILVRITDTEQFDIHHWNDEWLDPYWNVEILSKDHPAIPEGLRSTWIYGSSYKEGTTEVQPVRARVAIMGDQLVL